MTDDVRPLRADALRNRDRLLSVASTTFADHGVDVSLEEIARRAEVGVGTLYRHFPTRDALVEAVYRAQVEELCASADELRETKPAGESLRAWLHLFVEHVATKRGLALALKAAIGHDSALFAHTHSLITGAVTSLVADGEQAGVVRGDLDPLDVLRAVSGMSQQACDQGRAPSAHVMVDVFVDGMQHLR